jgi:hypothetical protein
MGELVKAWLTRLGNPVLGRKTDCIARAMSKTERFPHQFCKRLRGYPLFFAPQMDPKHSLLGQNSQSGLKDCLDWIVTIISINSPTAEKTEFSDKLLGTNG